MLATKDLYNKVFDYKDSWGETLSSIAWAIRDSYYRTIIVTLGQVVFGRYMLSNLASVVDWQVLTAAKQSQVYIDHAREKSKLVTHDYAIGDKFYVGMTGIYLKLGYSKQGPYIITGVFKNCAVRVQRRQVNEIINIIRLKPHFN